MLRSDSIQYLYKGDRSDLIKLYTQRGEADDIIIIKDGFVTDSYWSNLIFRRDGRWYTPDTPLLRGTMRQYLLDEKQIESRTIHQYDLRSYNAVMTINALNPFDESRSIPIDQIQGI